MARSIRSMIMITFRQHAFTNRLRVIGHPFKVVITKEALDDMYFIVDEASDEVGWLGTVERNENELKITEVFLPIQRVGPAVCELDEGGLTDIAMHLIESREDGAELFNKLRFWGHSHVNMGTTPSGQDDNQIVEFAKNVDDFFIRGIFNKKGEITFTVYLFDMGVVIDDCIWELEQTPNENRREVWKAELRSKVSKIHTPTIWKYNNYAYSNYGYGSLIDPEPLEVTLKDDYPIGSCPINADYAWQYNEYGEKIYNRDGSPIERKTKK